MGYLTNVTCEACAFEWTYVIINAIGFDINPALLLKMKMFITK